MPGAAIFAGIGALQGLGDAMEHKNRVQEAMDMAHKDRWDQVNAQQTINKAKADDEADATIRTKQATLSNNAVIKEYQAAQQPSAYTAPAPQPPTAQPMAQPSAMPNVAGVPGQNSAPMQPNTAPMPNMQMANNAAPAPAPQGGLLGQAPAQPDDGTVPPAPPTADIPPNSPAAMVAGQADMQHAAQTKDPYDMMANKVSTGVGPDGKPLFGQNTHDMYMQSHAMYPNLSPEALGAGVLSFAQGNWKDYDSWSSHMAKLDSNREKETGGVIREDAFSNNPNAKDQLQALRSIGDFGDGPIELPNQTKTEVNIRAKENAASAALAAGSAAAVESSIRAAGLEGKYSNGPGVGFFSDLVTATRSWTGQKPSEVAAAAQEASKEKMQSSIALMRSIPGNRPSAKQLEMDSQAVQNPKNSTPANLYVLNTQIGDNVMAYERSYLRSTLDPKIPSQYGDHLIVAYTENNPPFLDDGKTPNPNWMPAKEWLKAGAPQGEVTHTANEKSARDTVGAKSKAADEGKNPAEVKAPAMVSSAEDYNKLTKGQQYKDPQGNLRTKQ